MVKPEINPQTDSYKLTEVLQYVDKEFNVDSDLAHMAANYLTPTDTPEIYTLEHTPEGLHPHKQMKIVKLLVDLFSKNGYNFKVSHPKRHSMNKQVKEKWQK